MKVLLMAPLTCFLSEHPSIPDLGLGYLASAIKKEGHSIQILDWNCRFNARQFTDYLKENKPDLIGMKVFTINISAVMRTLSVIKKSTPTIRVALGGPHISATPPHEVVEEFKDADFFFQGEAERAFTLFLRIISGKGDHQLSKEEIPGLVWRENGTIRYYPIRLVEDLDSLDFPSWDLIHPKYYNVPRVDIKDNDGYVAPIITTRGCPAKCTFCCAYHVNGRRVRARSVQNIIEEIDLLYHQYKVRQMMIMDTNFTFYKDLVSELCIEMIRKKLDIKWDCVSSEKWYSLDKEIYQLMYQAGCRTINIGIESGSDRMRKMIGKSGSVSEISRHIDLIRETGIKIRGFFLLGFPEETLEDMKKTIDFAFSLKLDSLSFEMCYPLPGSELYSILKQKYNIPRIKWDSFDIFNSPYSISEVGSKEVGRLVKRYQRKALSRVKLNKISGKILRIFAR